VGFPPHISGKRKDEGSTPGQTTIKKKILAPITVRIHLIEIPRVISFQGLILE
jgi:hypothetical protein